MYDKVKCEICSRLVGSITSQHLKTHNLTRQQYKLLYPNSPLESQKILDTRKQNCIKMKGKKKKVKCEKCSSEFETASVNHWTFICDKCREAERYEGKIYIPEKDLVVCQICWIGLDQITTSHLSLHEMTIEQYRERFPKAWLTNKKIREQRRLRHTGERNPMKDKRNTSKVSEKLKFTSQTYIDKYPWIFPDIEKIRDNLGFIEVVCKKCGRWFVPTYTQLYERIRALSYGSDGGYLYCSDKCKQECTLYRFNPGQEITKSKKWYTDQEYNVFKNEVLKRQKEQFGFNFCELCETKSNLQVHHQFPRKTHPHMSLDPDNGIVLCEDCHIKKIHREECSTAKLSYKC